MDKKGLLINLFSNNVALIDPEWFKNFSELPLTFDAGGNLISPFCLNENYSLNEKKFSAESFSESRGNIPDGSVIALLDISGPIEYRETAFTRYFGLPTVERIENNFDRMMADAKVGTIILRLDSPGGSSFGVPELAEKIYQSRSQKRIIAIADSIACSAAYWLGSSASEFYVIPSGLVGSVGVYIMHVDYSTMYKDMGIDFTYISAGEKKTDGSPYKPLSESAKTDLQEQVNLIYQDFLSAVAKHRKVSASVVSEDFGKGGVKLAEQGLSSKMVDGIISFKDLLVQESSKISQKVQGRAYMENAKVYFN